MAELVKHPQLISGVPDRGQQRQAQFKSSGRNLGEFRRGPAFVAEPATAVLARISPARCNALAR